MIDLRLIETQSFAKAQIDYVLGKNPMTAPYIVGSNPNSPQNPHSAMASGGDDIGQIDTSPAQEAYVLYGGVVGGPDSKDRFYDIRSDYVETEVCFSLPFITHGLMSFLDCIGLQCPDANHCCSPHHERHLGSIFHRTSSRFVCEK